MVPLWPFVEANFPSPTGKPRTKQGISKILNKLGVKIHYFGNLALVDPAEVAEKLRTQADPYAVQRLSGPVTGGRRRRGRQPIGGPPAGVP